MSSDTKRLTDIQKKAFESHRKDANERIKMGCVPNFCLCSLTGAPCEDAIAGKLHTTRND
jgi:hypothetical protein